VRRRPGPFSFSGGFECPLNCVSRALEIRLGRHRSFLAPQNIPCPPSGEKTSPKRLTASVSPTPGPYLDAPNALAIRTQLNPMRFRQTKRAPRFRDALPP